MATGKANDPLVRTVPFGERQVMQYEEPGRGQPIAPLDWLKVIPFQAVAASGPSNSCKPRRISR